MKYAYMCYVILWFYTPGILVGQQTAKDHTNAANLQTVQQGKKLFTGQIPLVNGGPSCISCHTLNDPALPVSGGTLAINITSFAGLPVEALQNRIMEIPFPYMAAMKSAYANRPVTKQEANTIIAYLKYVSVLKSTESKPLLAGSRFLWAGSALFFLYLGIIWLNWRNRKKGSVNKKIYQRQI